MPHRDTCQTALLKVQIPSGSPHGADSRKRRLQSPQNQSKRPRSTRHAHRSCPTEKKSPMTRNTRGPTVGYAFVLLSNANQLDNLSAPLHTGRSHVLPADHPATGIVASTA